MQVYNLTTYPHLVGFFESLGVETEASDMSFGLSVDHGELEWASHGLHSVFAQRKNLFDPQFWLMIYEVVRFGQKAPQVNGLFSHSRLKICAGPIAKACICVSCNDTWSVH